MSGSPDDYLSLSVFLLLGISLVLHVDAVMIGILVVPTNLSKLYGESMYCYIPCIDLHKIIIRKYNCRTFVCIICNHTAKQNAISTKTLLLQ